jgi:hypothetical protein
MSTGLTIPNPEQLRAEIRARTEELRAMRRLLKLSEAALAARQRGAAVADLPPAITHAPERREEGDCGQ